MQIIQQRYAVVPIDSVQPHPRNVRRGDLEQIAKSQAENGFFGACLVQESSGHICIGNHRWRAWKSLGMTEIAVLYAEISDRQARKFLLADNATSDAATYDLQGLAKELQELQDDDDLQGSGYDDSDVTALLQQVAADEAATRGRNGDDEGTGARGPGLADRFLVPPFTVLDARQGYWQDRKRQWIALGIKGELGREAPDAQTQAAPVGAGGLSEQLAPRARAGRGEAFDVAGRTDAQSAVGNWQHNAPNDTAGRGARAPRPGGKGATAPAAPFGTPYGGGDAWRSSAKPPGAAFRPPEGEYEYPVDQLQKASGTSIFDPVLCELVYRWFCPPRGHVLDPFAGEGTKGIVAAWLDRRYTAVELRAEQIAANDKQWREIAKRRPDSVAPQWIKGDSAKIGQLLPEAPAAYDLVFTSPPYYDLEIYSQSEKDGSAFETYEKFIEWYREIFRQCVARLADDRFLVVKIGDVRDRKSGAYRNFLGDNIRCFLDLGLSYWNEAVLITAVGSMPVRAKRPFEGSRKLCRGHQNVLVFVKGNAERAAAAIGTVEVPGELVEPEAAE